MSCPATGGAASGGRRAGRASESEQERVRSFERERHIERQWQRMAGGSVSSSTYEVSGGSVADSVPDAAADATADAAARVDDTDGPAAGASRDVDDVKSASSTSAASSWTAALPTATGAAAASGSADDDDDDDDAAAARSASITHGDNCILSDSVSIADGAAGGSGGGGAAAASTTASEKIDIADGTRGGSGHNGGRDAGKRKRHYSTHYLQPHPETYSEQTAVAAEHWSRDRNGCLPTEDGGDGGNMDIGVSERGTRPHHIAASSSGDCIEMAARSCRSAEFCRTDGRSANNGITKRPRSGSGCIVGGDIDIDHVIEQSIRNDGRASEPGTSPVNKLEDGIADDIHDDGGGGKPPAKSDHNMTVGRDRLFSNEHIGSDVEYVAVADGLGSPPARPSNPSPGRVALFDRYHRQHEIHVDSTSSAVAVDGEAADLPGVAPSTPTSRHGTNNPESVAIHPPDAASLHREQVDISSPPSVGHRRPWSADHIESEQVVNIVARPPSRPSNPSPGAALDSPSSARRSPSSSSAAASRRRPVPAQPATYGPDRSTALHLAIRDNDTASALELIARGNSALINSCNVKGVTPLVFASQRGNVEVVTALLNANANTMSASLSGSTALIQGSHFGHLNVVRQLLRHGAPIEQNNYKQTTALMRASQEGHEDVVRELIAYGANVNRKNADEMNSLMLAAQRGNAAVVELLLEGGAHMDVCTSQDSTALMLAVKRNHYAVAKVLVSNGCELHLRDSRGRTARDAAERKDYTLLMRLLTPQMQIHLMKKCCRVERSYTIASVYSLLQNERATVRVGPSDHSISIHEIADDIGNPAIEPVSSHRQALIRSMAMPENIVQSIASFLPLPSLFNRRLGLLTSRCHVDPNATISCALDLIDEILLDGGILDALTDVGIRPPSTFSSWHDWRAWGLKCDNYDLDVDSSDADDLKVPPHRKRTSSLELTRQANFLTLLRDVNVARTLLRVPYYIPEELLARLQKQHDIQSLIRRAEHGVSFQVSIAADIVMICSRLSLWRETGSGCKEYGRIVWSLL